MIELDHALFGTHLKAWTLGSMLRTDLLGRALPWSRLVLFHGGPSDDLNLTGAHRLSVAMVALFALGLAASLFDPRFTILCLGSGLVFAMANLPFLRFLVQRKGVGFALAALPYHALHYFAAGLGYAWVLASEGPRHLLRRQDRRPT